MASLTAPPRRRQAGVKVDTRKNQVWISVSKPAARPVPVTLDTLKEEVICRWGVVGLLDELKGADWLTGFHTQFTSVATRKQLAPAQLRKRLLLVLFALGTNIGIKRIVHAGDRGVTEAHRRRIRGSFVTRDGLRGATAAVVGETLTGRDERWWGTGTACASDSKKFGSWESNLMTQWHARYGGPGSADVDPQITANYTDAHSGWVVGSRSPTWLGYRLLPRLKNVGAAGLYRPGDKATYPARNRS